MQSIFVFIDKTKVADFGKRMSMSTEYIFSGSSLGKA